MHVLRALPARCEHSGVRLKFYNSAHMYDNEELSRQLCIRVPGVSSMALLITHRSAGMRRMRGEMSLKLPDPPAPRGRGELFREVICARGAIICSSTGLSRDVSVTLPEYE